jgi:hypothetical protein
MIDRSPRQSFSRHWNTRQRCHTYQTIPATAVSRSCLMRFAWRAIGFGKRRFTETSVIVDVLAGVSVAEHRVDWRCDGAGIADCRERAAAVCHGVDVRLAVIQLRRERREGEARSRGHGRDQDGSTESESQQERRHRVGSLRQLVSAEGYNLRSLQGPERAWSWRASTPLAPFGNEKKVFASFFKKNASLPYVTHRNFVDRASASFFEKRYLRTTTRRVSSPSLSR